MNQSHHAHNHPNSYLSGVLYINADEAYDKIIFQHNRYEQITIPTTAWNPFNSETWFFPLESGEILLFPSRLSHLVAKKKGNNTRVSLSFNVFLKGDLGEEPLLTELKI